MKRFRNRLADAIVEVVYALPELFAFAAGEARWAGQMARSMWRSRFPRKAGQ